MVLGGWVWFADGGGSEHLLPGRGACAAGGFWVSIRNKLHLGVPKQDSRETKLMSERERDSFFFYVSEELTRMNLKSIWMGGPVGS